MKIRNSVFKNSYFLNSFPNVYNLDLSQNNIKYFDDIIHINLLNLQYLNLSRNPLISIGIKHNNKVLRKLKNFKVFDLSLTNINFLKITDIYIFRKMETLFFKNNDISHWKEFIFF